jgi:hypothetical protein
MIGATDMDRMNGFTQEMVHHCEMTVLGMEYKRALNYLWLRTHLGKDTLKVWMERIIERNPNSVLALSKPRK